MYLEFKKSPKILNIDNNAKTVKGQNFGYMTAIFYGASGSQSGFNVCPQASKGCLKSCLYTAGHGAFNNVQQGRINKTRWYIQERETFLNQLRKEIKAFLIRAQKKNLIPCIRLNGTSDISWENTGIMEEFSSVQFYDYTKVYKRILKYVNGQMPSNYHLTYSLTEDNKDEAMNVLKLGGNIAAVFRSNLPKTFKGFKVINADESDLRFLDGNNVIAGLKAKGKAKTDYSGFVLESEEK
tara:strand:+ start:2192 stop:2908 length:717 start_codon:yes stop_codon:yes gene_type:complete